MLYLRAVLIAPSFASAPELQKKAVLWGTVGAILMRLIFATILVEALSLIPLIHLGGGLVLVWIAIQLLKRRR